MTLTSCEPPEIPDDFGIDMQSEAVERHDVAQAKYTILREGLLLPVTKLLDSDGEETQNPMRAHAVVTYDASLEGDRWGVYFVDPGELWTRHE